MGDGVCAVSPQSFLFLISSDYERAEWRESIQRLQKNGKKLTARLTGSLGFWVPAQRLLFCSVSLPLLSPALPSEQPGVMSSPSCVSLSKQIPSHTQKSSKGPGKTPLKPREGVPGQKVVLRTNWKILCVIEEKKYYI